MLPYIITFALVFVMLHMTLQRTQNVSFLKILICIFPLILLAALRSDDVGSDMYAYIMPMFNYALRCIRLEDFFVRFDTEFFYGTFTYLCTRISGNPEFYLGVMSAFTVIPFSIGAYRLRKHISILMAIFLYCMYSYNDTMNLQRQSIALGFTFLALSFYIDKKYIIGLLFLPIGFFFHTSAFIGLIIPVVLWFTGKYPFKQYRFRYYFIIIGAIIVTISLSSIAFYLIGAGYLLERYDIYFNDSTFKAHVSSSSVICKFFVLYLVLIARRYESQQNSHLLDFAMLISIFDIIFLFSGLITLFLARIGLYTTMVAYFTIPYCLRVIYRNKRLLTNMVVILYMAYWCYMYVVVQVSETVPYTFR